MHDIPTPIIYTGVWLGSRGDMGRAFYGCVMQRAHANGKSNDILKGSAFKIVMEDWFETRSHLW